MVSISQRLEISNTNKNTKTQYRKWKVFISSLAYILYFILNIFYSYNKYVLKVKIMQVQKNIYIYIVCFGESSIVRVIFGAT